MENVDFIDKFRQLESHIIFGSSDDLLCEHLLKTRAADLIPHLLQCNFEWDLMVSMKRKDDE